MSSGLLAECPPPTLSPRTSGASQRSSSSLGRISRKHRQKKSKARNVSIKFQAQNFVKNRGLGVQLDEHYEIGDKIGEGGFGEVFSVVHLKTGAERAVKVIYKTEDDDVDFEKVNTTIRNEFAVVKSLDHPNLLKQYEMFEDDDKFMIVTDLYRGGELLDELENIGPFQEDDAALLMNHVLTCINYIHQNNLAHRDLKPENVLLEENMKLDDIKIIDFGLATRTAPGAKLKDFVGTSYYMSPQIVKEEPYTFKCDIWACGVIAFLVLGGYAPFDGDEIDDICNSIEAGEVIFDDEPDVWDSVSYDAKEFIRYLLTYEEEARPTAFEALQHPWLTQIRRKSRNVFRRQSSISANIALENMENFEAGSKLKQATYALIASQLLLKSEKEEIDEVFRVMDTDCSGRLSKEEVQRGYKDFFDQELTNEEVDVIFKRVNFSGSGTIEYSEFVVASLMQKDLLNDQKLKAAFEEFDMDGNGFIDSDELKEILVVDDDMTDYVMDKIIKQVDKDGDGLISYEEFKSMMYITASQPSKDRRDSWARKRNDSGGALGEETVRSSLSSRNSSNMSMMSLKEISGAKSVLSIFDVTSQASIMLDALDGGFGQDASEEDAMPPTRRSVSQGTSPANKSLSQFTDGAAYTDNNGGPAFRRNRSLPQRFDPRRGFLKVNFSFSREASAMHLRSDGELPALPETMSASQRMEESSRKDAD